MILGTGVQFDMVPIPAGSFWMGSTDAEVGHRKDEGPQRRVVLDAFWMGVHEVTWEEYSLWAEGRDLLLDASGDLAKRVDGIARPTPAYTDMSFGMGRDDHPAICMTQHAAATYCEWLSAVTGREYRLPTEAEWEYACRAGTETPFYYGGDQIRIGHFAWSEKNSKARYHPVGQKTPNEWGLFDMHGNVAEWVQDQYDPNGYAGKPGEVLRNPLVAPTTEFPRVVRGGSFMDPPVRLRSAARQGSTEYWKRQDPQFPKSIWYHTDAKFVGFRVVRPYR